MMVNKTGELIATRALDHASVADLHGAALVARRDEPVSSDANDLSNVVPFARPRRQGDASELALPSVAEADRLSPAAAKFEFGRGAAWIAGSLLLHGALLAAFWQEPPPMASIGIEVMTVELTLGATAAAGLAPTPGEQEVQAVQSAEAVAPDDAETRQSQVATLQSQEVPVAAQDTAPDAKPQETPQEMQTAEPGPQEPLPEPQVTMSEVPAQTKPVEKPPEEAVQKPPQVPAAQPAPERKRIAAPTKKMAEQKNTRAAATPTDAASGIGRGRSDLSANYNGMVAAHLARYKQYPAAARSAGTQGTAAVSFTIDGGGRVTSARLARSSGNSALDQEVVAMARRASPFPRPPDGQGRNFTVPVRFNLR